MSKDFSSPACKAVKKLRRKQAQFLKQEPNLRVRFLESSSQTVFVGNGGTQNGLSADVLVGLVKEVFKHGPQSDEDDVNLCLPLAKDYCFMQFGSVECASTVVEALNGICLQQFCKSRCLNHLLPPSLLTGPPLHLYLCCVDRIPPELLQSTSTPKLPAGLILVTEFVSPDEETSLLAFFTSPHPSTELTLDECCVVEREDCEHDEGSSETATFNHTSLDKPTASPLQVQTLTPTVEERGGHGHPKVGGSEVGFNSLQYQLPSATLKHRKVKHYGYEFLYGSNNVDPDSPLPGGLPEVCKPLLGRLYEAGYIHDIPDQLTINEYLPGAGIPPHVDTHSAFEDGIVSVTLGSQAVMDFRHTDDRKVSVFLPRRSVLVMSGESRYLWTHGQGDNSDPCTQDGRSSSIHAWIQVHPFLFLSHGRDGEGPSTENPSFSDVQEASATPQVLLWIPTEL